jgi:hypothetical protein
MILITINVRVNTEFKDDRDELMIVVGRGWSEALSSLRRDDALGI